MRPVTTDGLPIKIVSIIDEPPAKTSVERSVQFAILITGYYRPDAYANAWFMHR
jgi:hypothetical protein